jgi:DNA-binding NarL/FixJ family response regulator
MNTGARRSCRSDWSERKQAPCNHNGESGPHNTEQKLRILVAAENRLLCEALTRMLGKQESVQITCVNLSNSEDVKSLSEHVGDVLLLSGTGQLMADIEMIHKVRASAPDLRVLLLGMNANEGEFLQCVRAGISGYLPQDASSKEVLNAIQSVAAGEAVCRGSLCRVLFRYFEQDAAHLPSAAVRERLGLTRREQQLIPLIAQGLTNKEIANHFSLSEQTIKNHVHRMKNKIGAGDRLDIVQLYRVQGFLV